MPCRRLRVNRRTGSLPHTSPYSGPSASRIASGAAMSLYGQRADLHAQDTGSNTGSRASSPLSDVPFSPQSGEIDYNDLVERAGTQHQVREQTRASALARSEIEELPHNTPQGATMPATIGPLDLADSMDVLRTAGEEIREESPLKQASHDSPIASESSPVSTIDPGGARILEIVGLLGKTGAEAAKTTESQSTSLAKEGTPIKGNSNQAEESPRMDDVTEAGFEAAKTTEPQSTVRAEETIPAKIEVSNAEKAPRTSESTAVIEPPVLLAAELVQKMKASDRKQFKKGDVAVILDPHDLTKTLRIASKHLASSSILPKLMLESGVVVPVHGLKYIFALSVADETPILRGLSPASSLESFDSLRPELYPKGTQQSKAGKVKQEEHAITLAPTTNEDETGARTDSAAAYTILFDILYSFSRRDKRQVFDPDATQALTQVEAVLAIAAHYQAEPAVRAAFTHMFDETWNDNRSIFAAITEDPATWLVVATAMRHKVTFKEAFIHLVGREYVCSKREPDVSSAVLASIALKTKEAELHRLRINQALYSLTIQVAEKVVTKKDAKKTGVSKKGVVQTSTRPSKGQSVNIEHHPVTWVVVNLFNDWVREHLDFIVGYGYDDEDDTPEKADDDSGDPFKATPTCDHPSAECRSLGGVYRLLGKGGDAYLPAEKVIELLGALYDASEIHESRVREALVELKTKAARIVAPLLRLELRSDDADKLDYLTCAPVLESDIPWVNEAKEEDGEDDEEET